MGTVTSIESARGFGLKRPPYAGFIMATLKHDSLLTIKLPRGEGGAPLDTLVLLGTQRTSAPLEIELVLDDSKDVRILRRLMSVSEVPSFYDPRPLAPAADYLKAHASEVHQLAEHGAVHVGQLTVARAVQAMVDQGLDAQAALRNALATSASIEAMELQSAQQRKALLSSVG